MTTFSVSTTNLLSRLKVLQMILPKTVIVPIDEYFLFEITPGNLRVTANDGRVQLSFDMDIVCSDTFSTALPGKIIVNTMSLWKSENIVFSYSETKNKMGHIMSMKSGANSAYKLACIDSSHFGLIKTTGGELENNIQVDSDYLKKALLNCTSFIDNSESAAITRPALQGISISLVNNTVRVTTAQNSCATRLSFPRKDSYSTDDAWKDIIAPRTIGDLAEFIISNSSIIKISHNSDIMIMSGTMFNITCKLSEHTFPQMDSIMNQIDEQVMAPINREQIRDAIKRIKFYNDKSYELVMNITANGIEMSAESLSSHEGEEFIPCKMPKEIAIGINLYNVIDILNKIETEVIEFYYLQHNLICFFKPVGQVEFKEIYMAMPLITNKYKK